MKKLVCTFLSLSLVIASYSQTIFTYGNKAVSKDEFLRAFNKNPNPVANRKQALKEYLDLYINYKLKVQAAYDAKLNEDPTQKFELENFKQQIAENILNEEARIDELVKEAFQRSQKDIHLAQVFVEVKPGGDTSAAYQAIQSAYKALKAGQDFTSVVREFSNDQVTKQSGGDLSFITAFTLPYQFENVAYKLKPGAYSAPFKSSFGYHIFKNVEERKSVGTRKVSQILIALPPFPSQDKLQSVTKQADSVYNLLQKGASFEDLVRSVSNDNNSVANGGLLPELGIGQYDAAFEQAAFALSKPGEISKPFLTNYGFHILKLQEIKPVATDYNDAMAVAAFKEKVTKDDRLTKAKKSHIARQLAVIKYKPSVYNEKELWRYTDSALSNGNTSSFAQVNAKTILFSFAQQKFTVADWMQFVKAIKQSSNPISRASYKELMQEYVNTTGAEYYRNHLSEYSPSFKQQVQEFKEANMLFGIMDVNVWSRANTDTAGLQEYYNKNKSKYQWEPSADALIIVSSNQQVAIEVKQKISPDFSNWRSVIDGYNGTVTADSGRYELSQLPVVDRTNFLPGVATVPVKNDIDGTYTFNYIIKVYKQNEQRNFDDARGMVISDYQQVLEDRWLAQLKKKYPVKVNTAVFNSIK
jgi:peptidyl-prolyl cis-trans isomerase SurA